MENQMETASFEANEGLGGTSLEFCSKAHKFAHWFTPTCTNNNNNNAKQFQLLVTKKKQPGACFSKPV